MLVIHNRLCRVFGRFRFQPAVVEQCAERVGGVDRILLGGQQIPDHGVFPMGVEASLGEAVNEIAEQHLRLDVARERERADQLDGLFRFAGVIALDRLVQRFIGRHRGRAERCQQQGQHQCLEKTFESMRDHSLITVRVKKIHTDDSHGWSASVRPVSTTMTLSAILPLPP